MHVGASYVSTESVELKLPVLGDYVCVSASVQYASFGSHGRPGRTYALNGTACYVYVPPQASQNFVGSSAFGGLIGGVLGGVILALLVVVLLVRRHRKAVNAREAREQMEAARTQNLRALTMRPAPKLRIEPIRRRLSRIQRNDDGTYALPVLSDRDGIYAQFHDSDATYEGIYGGGERADHIYEPLYEVTYDELRGMSQTEQALALEYFDPQTGRLRFFRKKFELVASWHDDANARRHTGDEAAAAGTDPGSDDVYSLAKRESDAAVEEMYELATERSQDAAAARQARSEFSLNSSSHSSMQSGTIVKVGSQDVVYAMATDRAHDALYSAELRRGSEEAYQLADEAGSRRPSRARSGASGDADYALATDRSTNPLYGGDYSLAAVAGAGLAYESRGNKLSKSYRRSSESGGATYAMATDRTQDPLYDTGNNSAGAARQRSSRAADAEPNYDLGDFQISAKPSMRRLKSRGPPTLPKPPRQDVIYALSTIADRHETGDEEPEAEYAMAEPEPERKKSLRLLSLSDSPITGRRRSSARSAPHVKFAV